MSTGDRSEAAATLLASCVRDSLELREGAILAPDGTQLFATDGTSWADAVAELWDRAGAREREVSYVHVATEEGEVLAVRGAAGSVVATSDRFPLASLVLSDLRAVLRELS